jgi:hypothetical protein
MSQITPARAANSNNSSPKHTITETTMIARTASKIIDAGSTGILLYYVVD